MTAESTRLSVSQWPRHRQTETHVAGTTNPSVKCHRSPLESRFVQKNRGCEGSGGPLLTFGTCYSFPVQHLQSVSGYVISVRSQCSSLGPWLPRELVTTAGTHPADRGLVRTDHFYWPRQRNPEVLIDSEIISRFSCLKISLAIRPESDVDLVHALEGGGTVWVRGKLDKLFGLFL